MSTVPTPIHRNGDEDLEMMGARSEDPLAPQYEDPDSLSRKPPSAVTYKKAEEAVDTQPNPSVSGGDVGIVREKEQRGVQMTSWVRVEI